MSIVAAESAEVKKRRKSSIAILRFPMAPLRVATRMMLMGLSLLPSSALLLAVPAIDPMEPVLSDTLPPTRSRLSLLVRRLLALVTAFCLIMIMLAFAIEFVTVLGLPGGTFYSVITRAFMSERFASRLPVGLVEHWPEVLLVMYLVDLAVLLLIGKVPLSYSMRNLVVRWRITALTMLAFCVVLFMLTFMLAFVNGISKLTQQSGVPGNVMLLSDGATDELFSTLAFGEVSNLDRIIATEDEDGNRLAKPISVKKMNRGRDTVYMGSRETYCVVNQIIPKSDDRRRFVQLRIVVDADVSAAVHKLKLLDDRSRWWVDRGTDDQHRIECVLGQGVAATLGPDVGKSSLEPGDTFELADLQWAVVGVMHTEGTTFGSELWCSNVNLVTEALGKKSYTSYVMRVNDDSERSAEVMAYHIRNRYQSVKLKAVPEKEYFADLNKNNQQMSYTVIVVAVVMAIGGIFGIMNTMYSAIAQRTKDIGILRLLGFKRWQVLVSFLLESMTIALLGGLLGVLLGSLSDGFAVTSIASSGQGGGGKSVAAKLVVDRDVILIGMLFTMVMGRLGGLVPALSAMRLKILESLR